MRVKSNQIKYLFIATRKNQCSSYINNIIINDVLVQKGSGGAMLVKFLNPLEDEQNSFLGGI